MLDASPLNPSTGTDEAWIASLRADPPAAEAVTRLRESLRRGLARALSARHDVVDADLDDFAQDAVMRVLERLGTFRGESRFTTWAMAIAIRVALTALRRRRWGDRSLDEIGVAAEPPAPQRGGSDPAATSARGDVLAALRLAIDRDLTARQRTAVLAELAGMPTAALAEQLGTNPNALYKLHHDARKRLRGALEEMGFSEADVSSAVRGTSR